MQGNMTPMGMEIFQILGSGSVGASSFLEVGVGGVEDIFMG